MGRVVGFTGTSSGATPQQLSVLEERLAEMRQQGFDEFHHGLCIGADEQAAKIAKALGFRVVAHPGLEKDPANLDYRSRFAENDEVLEAKPFIDRDHEIVDLTERILAIPQTVPEELGSGTWETVGYAREHGKPVELILPHQGADCF